MTNTVEKILLAAPRGYCAGVDRAVQTVERALARYGPPVYVRKEIVHNKHVVEQLRQRGAIFVESETEVPEGSVDRVLRTRRRADRARQREARRLRTIDATCPLVTKVHVEARRFAADGYIVVLVGHDGHEEVEGTMGEAPDNMVLVQTEQDVDELELADPREGRLHLPDHAVGRRDTRHHRPPARALPGDRRASHRRHLLRDDEPPGGGAQAGRRV